MCDCVIASGGATRRGTMLFGKNSDREADEAQPVKKFARRTARSGDRLACTYIEIDEVPETRAVLGTGPFWCLGLENGVNERGVAIGNETVFTHEELELPDEGLLGMDLVRLGLERADTASEAVDILADLIETHGQGGPGWMHTKFGYSNGFLIADGVEAWTLQSSSRRWAAKRLGETDAITNQLSIGAEWDRASADAASFARERGWWDGAGTLDFAAAYRSTRLFTAEGSEGRLRRTRGLLAGARGDLDESAFFRLLRDHGGAPDTPPPKAERTDEAYFTVCAHNEVMQHTSASMVLAFDRPTRWFALGTPCTGVYLPLFLDGELPPSLLAGNEKQSDDSAWWRFKRLQRRVESDFAARLPAAREAFAPLEARWLADAAACDAPTERMAAALAHSLEVCDTLTSRWS